MRPNKHAPSHPVTQPAVGAEPDGGVSTESGFRYLLIRRDGAQADPAALETRHSTWKAGDEFISGDGVQRYRILDVVFSEMPPHSFNGVLLVEPIDV